MPIGPSFIIKIDMTGNLVVAKERYGQHGAEFDYVKPENQNNITVLTQDHKSLQSLTQTFVSVFLPQGFPDSVSRDYLVYQLWDTIQAFASSITGTLATMAVLKGVGVGDDSATPMAATMTWILKDGTGMLGRIMFAWLEGSDLDCNCKRWRLFADVMNDFAICMELLAPSFSSTAFTGIICFAGLCKALVGVAGCATRAALMQHQARRDNLADISAKDGSQETVVNLAALVCSLILIPVIAGNQSMIWLLFITFTILHLYANYMAVRAVVMETLNQARLYILLRNYINSGGHVSSVTEVNLQEPILRAEKFPLKIKLGCSMNTLLQSYSQLKDLCTLQEDSMYLLNLNRQKRELRVVLHRRSGTSDQLEACFEAMVIATCYDSIFQGSFRMPFPQLEKITAEFESGEPNVESVLRLSKKFVANEFQTFYTKLGATGWNTDKILLNPDEWRAVWNIEGLEGTAKISPTELSHY